MKICGSFVLILLTLINKYFKEDFANNVAQKSNGVVRVDFESA